MLQSQQAFEITPEMVGRHHEGDSRLRVLAFEGCKIVDECGFECGEKRPCKDVQHAGSVSRHTSFANRCGRAKLILSTVDA
jgi:hypothetical protein